MARAQLPGGLATRTFVGLAIGVALFAVISAMVPAIGQLTGRIPRTA